MFQNCTSNIIAVGISNEVSKSELTKIALGASDRVLKVSSTYDLEEETISRIEDMIEKGPIVPATQGKSFKVTLRIFSVCGSLSPRFHTLNISPK